MFYTLIYRNKTLYQPSSYSLKTEWIPSVHHKKVALETVVLALTDVEHFQIDLSRHTIHSILRLASSRGEHFTFDAAKSHTLVSTGIPAPTYPSAYMCGFCSTEALW